MPPGTWQVFDHTADVGFEVRARTRPELFETAALALFDLITDVSAVEVRAERRVSVEAPDTEELLVRWLSELLFLHDAEGEMFSRFVVSLLTPTHLTARVGGEPFDPARHSVKTEVKAVTYHQVTVRSREDGVQEARFVVDV
jgi:SHS2 domain-containing protein